MPAVEAQKKLSLFVCVSVQVSVCVRVCVCGQYGRLIDLCEPSHKKYQVAITKVLSVCVCLFVYKSLCLCVCMYIYVSVSVCVCVASMAG